MAEMQPLVGKKGKANYVVLKHFGFEVSDLEQTNMLCKICHATVSAPQGNTTNLFNHLKSTHRVIHDQAEKEHKNLKIKSSSTPATATQSSIKDTLCVIITSTASYFATTTDLWSSRTGIVFIFYFYTLFN